MASVNNKPKRRQVNMKRTLFIFVTLVVLTIGATLFLRSELSKVQVIDIQGYRFTTKEEITARLDLRVGQSYFTSTEQSLERKVAKLPAVEEVVVTKDFPGKVAVVVSEFVPVAYELQASGKVYVQLANGYERENTNANVVDKPILNGWSNSRQLKARLCIELSKVPPELLADFSEIAPIPSIAYPDRIKIYTRSQFVIITSVSLLVQKLNTLQEVLDTQLPGEIRMLLADSYRPYQPEVTP